MAGHRLLLEITLRRDVLPQGHRLPESCAHRVNKTTPKLPLPGMGSRKRVAAPLAEPFQRGPEPGSGLGPR